LFNLNFFTNNRQEHKVLFALAIPMILSNITVPLLGMVDTAVIGHLPEAYFLGGTAVGNMVVTFAIWLCGFLRMSTSGLAAQAYGRESTQQAVIILRRGILLALALAVLLLLLQRFYIDFALYIAGGSEQVQFYARQYSEIRVWGYPAALVNLVILGFLLGMHQAKSAMWLLIITNLVNLSLDLLFVIAFNWQVKGVALATLCSEYLALALGLYFCSKLLPGQLLRLGKHLIVTSAGLSQYFRLNRDILIRTLCLEICFVFITFQGARLGDTVVAANAILLNFLLLISFGLDGIAYAAEARVGKAKGQQNIGNLRLSVKVAIFWNLLLAIAFSLVFVLFGDNIINLMSTIPEVVALSHDYLVWIIVLPVIACWCFLFDGVYIGLTQAKVMRNSMIIATFGCFFPVWFAFQQLGNQALWAAFLCFMAGRGITLGWHYSQQQDRQLLATN
jgi:MATE family multidrug resistance protein